LVNPTKLPAIGTLHSIIAFYEYTATGHLGDALCFLQALVLNNHDIANFSAPMPNANDYPTWC